MTTPLVALALVFMATLFTLLLGDYARLEQETIRTQARASRIAAQLVACELKVSGDGAGECPAALAEVTGDVQVAACRQERQIQVTATADWSPSLWATLSPLQVTATRQFEGWDALPNLGKVLPMCGLTQ